MNKNLMALKVVNLRKLVESFKDDIMEQYKRDLMPIATVGDNRISDDALFAGGCVYLNHLLCERLNDNGIHAKLVGGQATFGVNKNNFGVIEYGHDAQDFSNGRMSTIMPDGSEYKSEGFVGHAWVEIRKLDLIVDLTLLRLERSFQVDNLNRGIVDNDFLLSPDPVRLKSELLSRQQILSGRVGCRYSPKAEHTKELQQKVAQLKEAVA